MAQGETRDIEVGAEVSGYRLTHLLGEGGMATVFRGENLLNPRIVRAIKIVHPELGGRREFVKRFAAEANILEQLSHPNVVKFYGVRQDQGRLVMELELLEGATLTTRLAPGMPPVPLKDVVAWALQAAQGLEAAHALGVLHRDIKPDNLFVVRDGTLKVLDFGIARALDEAATDTRQTKPGTTPGTAAYLAPEVWKAAEPTAAVDVYSLGLTLLELALGRHPFIRPGQRPLSSAQLMYLHLQEPLPLLRSERPDAPELLEQVITKATAREPGARYGSARELGEALRRVLQVLAGPPAATAGAATAPEVRTAFELPTLDLHASALPHAPQPASIAAASNPAENATSFQLAQFEPKAPTTAPILETRQSSVAASAIEADSSEPAPVKPRSRGALLAAGGALFVALAGAAAWTMAKGHTAARDETSDAGAASSDMDAQPLARAGGGVDAQAAPAPAASVAVEPAAPQTAPAAPTQATAGPGTRGPGLDSASVQRTVSANKAAVTRKCWESLAGRLPSANVNVRVTVGVSGAVTAVEGSGEPASMVTCVESQVKSWRFDRPGEPVVVVIPFKFVGSPEAPAKGESAPPTPTDVGFDRGAAQAQLGMVNISTCKQPDGPTGDGHVKITFAPNGTVAEVIIDSGAFPGTPVGGCIIRKFLAAHVPPFTGGPVRVGKAFTL